MRKLFQGAVCSEKEYSELGIPAEWIDPLKALGFTAIAKLKELEKPGILANYLNGYNKKNKLGNKTLGFNHQIGAFFVL